MKLSFVIIFVIIGFLLFLILREFWCWYFKINERVKLLTDIKNRLQDNRKEEIKIKSMQENSTKNILNRTWECSHCGAKNKDVDVKCQECGQLKWDDI